MRTFLLPIITLALGTALSAQHLEFFKENITMEIRDDVFYVSGTYYYRYGLDDKKLIYYPFPVSKHYGKVDSTMIYDLTNNRQIQPEERDEEGLLFLLDFSHANELAIQVSYRQEVPDGQSEYIIETTQAWKRPLEEATYQLIVPDHKRIISFSIPPDDSITIPREMIYTWEKHNFMPEQNMLFEFEDRQ